MKSYMKKVRKILIFTALAVLAVSCGSRKKTTDVGVTLGVGAQETIPLVEAVTATSRDVPSGSSYASTVEAYATNNIAPQTGGRIQKINVEVGDYVYKGQVLAEMDRLQLDQTRLQIVNDSTELARIRSLYAEGGVAKSDLDAMELAYNVRRATLKNLEENTILRSPISGYVTARNYDKGDMFTMALPLFTVQQVIPVKLRVGISESEYTQVKKGDAVTLTVDALPGRVFNGKVGRLYPTIDPVTHTFMAEVVVQNSDRALRPGMYARVSVTFGMNRSIVVPDRAIVKQEGTGQRFIYVINDDGTVTYTPVEVGRHMDREYEVLSGIEEGMRIVSKGQTGLKDGMKVKEKE